MEKSNITEVVRNKGRSVVYWKKCVVCDNEFSSKRSDALYCCSPCNMIASRKRKREKKQLNAKENEIKS